MNVHEQLTYDQILTEQNQTIINQDISVKKLFQFPDLSSILSFGKEVETRIMNLVREIDEYQEHFSRYNYPSRFLAIIILENDEEIIQIFKPNKIVHEIIELAEKYRIELEDYYGEDINTIISSEIYNNIHEIIENVV